MGGVGGGVWREVDRRDCISLRGQQFLIDADSIQQGQLMNIHEMLYSLSEVALYVGEGVVGGVSGGDLGAVGRLVRVIVEQQVTSAHGAPTDKHRLLLEVRIISHDHHMTVI